MTKVILNGCNGKMGRVVTKIAEDTPDICIVAGVDINQNTPNDYPVYSSPFEIRETADVIIDFSHPNCLEDLLCYAKQKKLGAVIATTGLSDAQKLMLNDAASDIAVFFSANMSLGINLIIDLAKRAAKLLEGSFDIEIIEKHHNQKIDAPSGTALAIADAISDTLSEKPCYVYDRHSSRKKRSKSEIGLHAVRGGTIVGEHEVIFAGNDEVIELKHHAASKEIFAVGAVKAAMFLKDKKPGMYNMNNLVESIM